MESLRYLLGYLLGYLSVWKIEASLIIITIFIWITFMKWKNLSKTQKFFLPISSILSLFIISSWIYFIMNNEWKLLFQYDIFFYAGQLLILYYTIVGFIEGMKNKKIKKETKEEKYNKKTSLIFRITIFSLILTIIFAVSKDIYLFDFILMNLFNSLFWITLIWGSIRILYK